jgi:hypothetical protein
MPNNEIDLDRLLDDGIRTYVAADPLVGLEQRILTRTRSAPQPNYAPAVWAAAAFTLSVIIVLLFYPSSAPRSGALTLKTSAVASEKAPAMSQVRTYQRVRHRRRTGQGLPKRAVFPIPQPVTTEEHLLLALIEAHPEQTAQAFDRLRKSSAPIEIKPIEIKPLGQSDKNKGGE